MPLVRVYSGALVEPITVWQPPHTAAQNGMLDFDVVSQRQAMAEWTPFFGLHPPHLDDGFVSRRGPFQLGSLPGGRTPLTGTCGTRSTCGQDCTGNLEPMLRFLPSTDACLITFASKACFVWMD